MAFITAGMGGGTGTGARHPVIARAAREMGILTVGVVTKPFQFEGLRRMRLAEAGVLELQQGVDTLIVIPNQNLFRVANEKTTFADAFAMADQVLYSGVACITDLMVKEGLINLDFADVRAIMRRHGQGHDGDRRGDAARSARAEAAEAAIANPLLDEVSMKGARGLLISITGGRDLTLYELDEAATRIREEVDQDANIILGATFDESSSRAPSGSRSWRPASTSPRPSPRPRSPATEQRIAEVAERSPRRGPHAGHDADHAETWRRPNMSRRSRHRCRAELEAVETAGARTPVERAPVVHNDVTLTPAPAKRPLLRARGRGGTSRNTEHRAAHRTALPAGPRPSVACAGAPHAQRWRTCRMPGAERSSCGRTAGQGEGLAGRR